jgi:hypothetical protein
MTTVWKPRSRRQASPDTDRSQAWALYRVSTKRQGEEDRHSLHVQRESVERAAAKLGARITKSFEYPGASAFEKSSILAVWAPIREALRKLPGYQRPEVVLVYDESRAFRNLGAYDEVTEALAALGVRWAPSHNPQADPRSSQMAHTVVGDRDRSLQTSKAVRAAQEHARQTGTFTHKPPYPYVRDYRRPGKPLIGEEGPRDRAAILDIIGGQSASKAHERHRISLSYNQWVAGLCSPFRAGVHPESGVEAAWEPLISLEEHAALLRALGKAPAVKAQRGRRKGKNPDFPLLIRCTCGRHLSGYVNSKSYPVYECKRKAIQGRTEACAGTLDADKVHAWFLDELASVRWIEEPESYKAQIAAEYEEATRQATERRAHLERQRRNLDTEANLHSKALTYETNPSVAARKRTMIDNLEAEIARIDAELSTLVTDAEHRARVEEAVDRVAAFLRDPVAMWQQGDLDERRAVLKAIWPDELIREGRNARTTELAPIFGRISANQPGQTARSLAWYARQGSNLRPPA